MSKSHEDAVADVDHSAAFYDAVLGALGMRRVMQMPDERGLGEGGLVGAVRRAFPKLALVWASDIGIELMNVDAKMCLSAAAEGKISCSMPSG